MLGSSGASLRARTGIPAMGLIDTDNNRRFKPFKEETGLISILTSLQRGAERKAMGST
jgi:hypothetical protein